MAFGNSILLLAMAGVAAPIVLHLTMRPKPRRMTFPALQFVARRQETNRRRLQLRQWVLLALRCLAIVLAALALARPSVASAETGRWLIAGALGLAGLLSAALAVWSWTRPAGPGRWVSWGLLAASGLALAAGAGVAVGAAAATGPLIGDQEAPVAAVLVIDTSPRMEYVQAGETRLEAAQALALRLIRELPEDSQVAVLDSRRAGAFFSADRAAARTSVERTSVRGVSHPLTDILSDAVQLAASSDLTRQEIYIFTDLSQAAWPDSPALQQRLRAHPELLFYAFDVGVRAPRNVALGDVQLSATTLGRGGQCVLSTDVRSLGLAGDISVRVDVERFEPTLPEIRDGKVRLPSSEPRGRATVQTQSGQATSVELRVTLDEPGVHHGRVLLESEDALAADNLRHFTLEVRDAWPVLLAHGPHASPDFVESALAPEDYRDFACTVSPQGKLSDYDLSPFAAICLLDPEPLDDAMWLRLQQYVQGGGGLWVQLGRNAEVAALNRDAPQRVLPGHLTRQWRAGGRELFWDLRDGSHPALRLLREQATSLGWSRLPVFRHWVLDPVDASARVLIGYSDNRFPAVLEQELGAGRVVVSTTPLSDIYDTPSAWNELVFGENNWPVFVLANELLLSLVQEGGQRLNYVVGEPVSLSNDEREEPLRYQLFSPSEPPQDVASREGQLSIGYTDAAGAYRLKGNRDGPRLKGFSCNLPAAATDLQRIDEAQLQSIFGPDRCQVASNWEQLERVQGRQRVGREFFPLLMVLLAVVLGMELLLANRFYGDARASSATRAAAAGPPIQGSSA